MKNILNTHFPALFFYEQFNSENHDANRKQFHRLAAELDVEYIQVFRGPRLYSIKDWNKKVTDTFKVKLPEGVSWIINN